MHDYIYNEEEAKKVEVHQERYLTAPMVRGWFREVVDALRKVDDDELIEQLEKAGRPSVLIEKNVVGFSLSDIDGNYFVFWEAQKRTYLSEIFKWRFLFILMKVERFQESNELKQFIKKMREV